MEEPAYAHQLIAHAFQEEPKLFPASMAEGYKLNGKTPESKKQGIRLRRIRTGNRTYQLRPVFHMPYMRGEVELIANALYLTKFGVPFFALAVVFGKNAMYWYRCFIALSKYSLMGTSHYGSTSLPSNLVVDEQHTRLNGDRIYVATTVANECILGAEASKSCDDKSLASAYGICIKEARTIDADYQSETVNTDGWKSTQNAWKSLCPKVKIVECFLHGFIKVRDRATKKLKDHFLEAADKIWDCYKAETKRSFSQRIRRLREWAKDKLETSPMKENINKLCAKTKVWQDYYDHPKAHRTSNMLDRLMKFMTRHAKNSQMFHSSIKATTDNFRAFALLYNFTPSCPLTLKKHGKVLYSPAARMNGMVYSRNWLENLLIAAAIDQQRQQQQNLL